MKTKTLGPFTFTIDRPEGTVKEWPGGKRFVYPVDYGFFPKLKGEDGEGLDAFVGDDPDGHLESFQKLKANRDGKLVADETKYLLGVNDRDREKIYRLYGREVNARRVYDSWDDVGKSLQRFEAKNVTKTAADPAQPGAAPPEEEKKPSFLRRHAVPLAGLATTAVAAPLIYSYLRRKNLSADPRVKALQEASKGQYTHVLDEFDPKSWYGRLYDKLRYAGGGNVIYKRELQGKVNVPGGVRYQTPSAMRLVIGDAAGGSTFEDYDLDRMLFDKFHEYSFFDKHAPGAMPASENVGDVLKGMGKSRDYIPEAQRAETFGALREELKKKFPKGFLLKELDGLQSGGRFPTESDDFDALFNRYLQKVKDGGFTIPDSAGTPLERQDWMRKFQADPDFSGRVLRQASNDPREVMVQEKLPLEKLTGIRAWLNKALGQNNMSKELRVHVENGVATPELTTSRFDILGSVLNRKGQREAAQYAQSIIDKLPEKQRAGTFAMDIAPIQGGGYKLIESNPTGRSGLLFTDPRMAANMFKHYTGQHSQAVAGLGAAAGGLAAGTAAAGAAGVGKYLTRPKQQAETEPDPQTPAQKLSFHAVKEAGAFDALNWIPSPYGGRIQSPGEIVYDARETPALAATQENLKMLQVAQDPYGTGAPTQAVSHHHRRRHHS